ncbi:MAG TPA: DmsE family decaheme c-type cytochrome [Bryobacteraceae bacterium]|nr:DmsE family decaheme c-type cytochrome [Bryobacteraceae bacterium]
MFWPPHAHVPTLSRLKRRRLAALASALIAAAALMSITFDGAQAAGQAPAAQAPPAQPAEAKSAAPAAPATYVGSETCQPCHDELFTAFRKNPHSIVETNKKRGWDGKACESCHGPGSRHAESADPADILNPAKLRPAEADKNCLKCHTNMPHQAARPLNAHARNDVGCVQCHSVHKKGPHGMVPRDARAVNTQCAACHQSVWAEFQRPYRHKLPEGSMSCTDCHDPHGALFPRSIRTVEANQAGCIKCHADKRGPFTFEHAPVRLEGCRTCHEPHGSANPRMMVRHEVKNLCLECHANLPVAAPGALGSVPPAFHDIRNPRFQNCTICHQKVHGSYVDRNLLR